MPFNIEWIEYCTGPVQTVRIKTPVAPLVLTVCQDIIANADWEAGVGGSTCIDNVVLQQLFDEYWRNTATTVSIKLLKQGSCYRLRVWAELCKIPFASTMTYAGLAQKLGSSARAVGNACRDNPYPLIIPCHRVVSAGGLGGYCGQTEGDFMAVKKKLLQWEKVALN